jgi:hypothetical protein
MPDYKNKQLTYRRAVWLSEGPAPGTLEALIRKAMGKLKTAADRQVTVGGGHFLNCAEYEPMGGRGIYLHLSATTPGEAASIIKTNNISTNDRLELATIPAPDDTEWLDGDSFVLIAGNHVCLCVLQLRETTVRQYFYQILAKANNG